MPWGSLGRLASLTSLQLYSTSALSGQVQQALASLPNLQRFHMTDAQRDIIAQVSGQLTELVLSMGLGSFDFSHLSRLTSLRRLVLWPYQHDVPWYELRGIPDVVLL